MPRSEREQGFLDDLSVEHFPIAKRWLDMEGGSVAVAALAIEIHDLRKDMARHWWRTPAQFIGVSVAAALAALMSWKGVK